MDWTLFFQIEMFVLTAGLMAAWVVGVFRNTKPKDGDKI